MASTRERLVDTARKLFLQSGYHGTSNAALLQEAAANSGSLYHFFGSKQDLLVAVLDHYLENIDSMLLEPSWVGVEDAVERVFALLDRYRSLMVETEFAFGCPIGLLALELHDPAPEVREKLEANFGAWAGAVRACLEEARERFPAELDRDELALHVLAVMEGAVMLARTHRDLAPFDAAVRQLKRHFDMLMSLQGGDSTEGASTSGSSADDEAAKSFQTEPGVIRWRLHLSSAPDEVYDALDTRAGREAFWADSAGERDGAIRFEIGRFAPYVARIRRRRRPEVFALEYFGTEVTFELRPDGTGGTDLHLLAEGVPENSRVEFIAGWVSLLLTMKAAVDHGVDLRNHDPDRTWLDGYADN